MRKWMKLSTLTALLVGAVLAGCTDQNTMAPEAPRAPQMQAISYSTSVEEDLKSILKGEAPDYTVRENSAVIGASGGYLYVSGHFLYVPAGAVTSPTTFTMQLAPDGEIGAELTAVDANGVNVGERGFRKPLTFALSYAYASNVPADPTKMAIGWVRADGTIETRATDIYPAVKIAVAQLDHFSKYILGTPW